MVGSPNRYYLMPGYTGHIPGMTTMDAGLTYMQQSGQFLDQAEHRDRVHRTVKISEPLEISAPKIVLSKELKHSKGLKSKHSSTKHQKGQTSSHQSVKDKKSSKSRNSGSSTVARSQVSPGAQSPPSSNLVKGISVKQDTSNQHMSPPSGYTGHIPGQLSMAPGMTYGQQTTVMQTGSWNPEESVLQATSPTHDPSYHKRPSGYTGHLPGAIHLEPGLSYRTVTKAVQHHLNPNNPGSRTSTSENQRVQNSTLDSSEHTDFFTTIPSGYSGHIPGMMLLEPGRSYSQQTAQLKKGVHKAAVATSPNRSPFSQFPSGYSGHIPGAQLLEPGLSYCQQTKLLDARLHELDQKVKGVVPSQPPSKPSTAGSKASSRGGTRHSRSSQPSRNTSKASTREPTPATAEKR